MLKAKFIKYKIHKKKNQKLLDNVCYKVLFSFISANKVLLVKSKIFSKKITLELASIWIIVKEQNTSFFSYHKQLF